MQKNMTDRTPGSYDDFVAYLGTVRTEEELFSRLTYWFAGQNRPEDVLSRSELVEARAKELGFWQGLTFRMERWLTDGKSELEAVGREEFQSRIAEDYAAYREKADAARARFRDRRERPHPERELAGGWAAAHGRGVASGCRRRHRQGHLAGPAHCVCHGGPDLRLLPPAAGEDRQRPPFFYPYSFFSLGASKSALITLA